MYIPHPYSLLLLHDLALLQSSHFPHGHFWSPHVAQLQFHHFPHDAFQYWDVLTCHNCNYDCFIWHCGTVADAISMRCTVQIHLDAFTAHHYSSWNTKQKVFQNKHNWLTLFGIMKGTARITFSNTVYKSYITPSIQWQCVLDEWKMLWSDVFQHWWHRCALVVRLYVYTIYFKPLRWSSIYN